MLIVRARRRRPAWPRGVIGVATCGALLACQRSANRTFVADTSGAPIAEPNGPPNQTGQLRYTTTFDNEEQPLLEGGAWHHTDPHQAFARTANGLAFGTQKGTESAGGNYNDSNAFLAGFPPNQRASAVIHSTGGTIRGNLEVELLLRFSEGAEHGGPYGATTQYGYEINMGQGIFGTFIQIGRWKDANLFDSTKSGSPLASMGIHDGDVFKAEMIDSRITVWLNDKVIASATDADAYRAGNPGIGFFRNDSPGPIDPQSYCFTSFTAEAL